MVRQKFIFYHFGLISFDFDSDCAEGLMCFQRERDQPVPGCQDRGPGFDSRGDYCVPMPIVLPNDEDDIDNAATAGPSLADEFSYAPASDAPASDAPVLAAESESTSVPAAVDDDAPLPLTLPGNDGEPADAFPLGECQVRPRGQYGYRNKLQVADFSPFVYLVFLGRLRQRCR